MPLLNDSKGFAQHINRFLRFMQLGMKMQNFCLVFLRALIHALRRGLSVFYATFAALLNGSTATAFPVFLHKLPLTTLLGRG
jgi:hypothetical protein